MCLCWWRHVAYNVIRATRIFLFLALYTAQAIVSVIWVLNIVLKPLCRPTNISWTIHNFHEFKKNREILAGAPLPPPPTGYGHDTPPPPFCLSVDHIGSSTKLNQSIEDFYRWKRFYYLLRRSSKIVATAAILTRIISVVIFRSLLSFSSKLQDGRHDAIIADFSEWSDRHKIWYTWSSIWTNSFEVIFIFIEKSKIAATAAILYLFCPLPPYGSGTGYRY